MNYFIKIIFITLLLFVINKGNCQTNNCYKGCDFKFDKNYTAKNQQKDFEGLSDCKSAEDSIQTLRRIIRFDCNVEIGRKASNLQTQLTKKVYKRFQGEWKLEWSDGIMDSLNANEKIVIEENRIVRLKNGKVLTKYSEFLCLGFDEYADTLYLLVKLDATIWRFYLESAVNRNTAAWEDSNIRRTLERQEVFLYLLEFGAYSAHTKKYYSKAE